jgi:hypothetical protein
MSVIAAMSLAEAASEVETQAWQRHCKPAISLSQALHSWFVYQGKAYQVKSAPPDVFSAWLASVVPASWTEADKALHLAAESGDDEEIALCRWYSLLGIVKARKKHKLLYASDQEAISGLK